jgi:hypothetical protein
VHGAGDINRYIRHRVEYDKRRRDNLTCTQATIVMVISKQQHLGETPRLETLLSDESVTVNGACLYSIRCLESDG